MNDEKKLSEAEMITDLETIESIIRTTKLLAEGMEDGVLRRKTLSKAIGDIRHILGLCAIMPDAASTLDRPPEMVRVGAAEGGRDHMGRPDAAAILCRMATSRKVNVNGVIALQMGVRSLLKRHFDRQRNWARRREQAANAEKGDSCHD